jgi:hypothetical protein
MFRMSRLPVFAAMILAPLALAAQATGDVVSSKIATYEAGVICAPEIIGYNEAPDTVAGVTNIIESEPPFVSTGRRVPAVQGIGFGIKSQSQDPFGLSDVQMVVTHPPMGPEGITRQSYPTTISGADTSLTFYQFDFDYELVTGPWTFEAMYQGQSLYRVTFDVVAPQAMPELAKVCGFEDLLS